LPRTRDALLACLHLYLAEKVGTGMLRRLGWFDFRSLEPPDTNDPVVLAEEVLVYLCLQDVGRWNGVVGVITALLAFLEETVGTLPTSDQLHRLQAILDHDPVSRSDLHTWFDGVYGP